MMKKFVALSGAMLMLTLSACSGAETTSVSEDAVVIDVRTAQEYSAGHLEGAKNLDWNSGQFADSVGQLDKNGDYLLYCRSGNRAGQAKQMLESQGFTKVTNLGSLEDAAAKTGKKIVK
ncbi:rhodanese-like domain-containing protein [Trueperella pecoris]|nr:rhodanese-like domain-containing protein [Trueperella pecoris]